MQAIGSPPAHGLVMRFTVVVDGFDLGSWSTCKGLDVAFKHVEVKELGNNASSTFIPSRAEYSKVTLQRAMRKGDWEVTKRWLKSVTDDSRMMAVTLGSAVDLTSGTSGGAKITLHDAFQVDVATWTLSNAMASAWKGPQLDASGHAVALETLELVHEGFLDD